MKICIGCNEEKEFSSFYKRSDSKDGYRNMCKTCVSVPPEGNSRKVKSAVGDKYNRWTIISRAESKADGTVKWNCKCDCGTKRVVIGSALRSGVSKSCGCLQTEKAESTRSDFSIVKKYYRSYRSGASYKWRQFEFDLTLEEFSKIITKDCHYCGSSPNDKRYHYHSSKGRIDDIFITVNGIDRVDNTKGYTSENTVPCCTMCNQMKLDYSLEDFLNKIKQIYIRSIDGINT